MDRDSSQLPAPPPSKSEEERIGAGAPCPSRGTDIFPHPSPQGHLEDFAITPRRRSGQDRRAPVVLTRELIESYFTMPLSAASKDLVRASQYSPNSFVTPLLCLFPDSSSSKSLPPLASSGCSHLPRISQGLCATAIKKVCRKMGISKWPFR
jgi:hypothetical protein